MPYDSHSDDFPIVLSLDMLPKMQKGRNLFDSKKSMQAIAQTLREQNNKPEFTIKIN